MADDKMRNDDLQKNVGGQGNKEGGQQTPGRNPQDDQSTGRQHPGTGNEPKRAGDADDGQANRRGDEGGQRR
jgi:hypothetical protein